MSNLIGFSGHLVTNGIQVAFQVAIGLPEQVGPSGDYMCVRS